MVSSQNTASDLFQGYQTHSAWTGPTIEVTKKWGASFESDLLNFFGFHNLAPGMAPRSAYAPGGYPA